MLLWTVQHRAAYEQMFQTGTLRANEAHLFCGDELKFAYDWLAAQMRERVGEPPEGVNYPVWAWYQYNGMRKRPDMRGPHRRYRARGTPIVLLTVDVPEKNVLLSDFDMWHCVLNNGYIDVDEADDESFCGGQVEIEQSWRHVLEIETAFELYGGAEERSIQATMWEIRAEWVKKAEFFTSR